jgi:hypothetical protein
MALTKDALRKIQRGESTVPKCGLHCVGCGWREKLRRLWKHYSKNTDALGCVDRADRERFRALWMSSR